MERIKFKAIITPATPDIIPEVISQAEIQLPEESIQRIFEPVIEGMRGLASKHRTTLPGNLLSRLYIVDGETSKYP